MAVFRMPSLGADMEAGKLVQWLKQPGDKIARGDIIAVVETEKGAIEVDVFEDGVMAEHLVAENTRVPVGTPLATIDTGEEEAAPPAPPLPEPQETAEAPPPLPEAEPAAAPAPPAAPVSERRAKASPAARAYAQAQGIDLKAVTGTGPDGAILRTDVEAATAAPPPGQMSEQAPEQAPAAQLSPGLDLDKMRHAIAAAMARSKREIPHYYLATRINLRRATRWLTEENAGRAPEERLLMNVLLLKAVALALEAHPQFNGFYIKEQFEQAPAIHVGTAVAIRGGGLVAPAIHHCDQKSLDDIMDALRDLVGRVRAGTVRSSELSDPTITVTSLGERGVASVTGVIYPPQVAIVGFGAPHVAPVAREDGALAAEPVVDASLAADHRVTDGHLGARFLNKIDSLLQEPEKL